MQGEHPTLRELETETHERTRELLKEAVGLLRWAHAYISFEDQGYLDAVDIREFLARPEIRELEGGK